MTTLTKTNRETSSKAGNGDQEKNTKCHWLFLMFVYSKKIVSLSGEACKLVLTLAVLSQKPFEGSKPGPS